MVYGIAGESINKLGMRSYELGIKKLKNVTLFFIPSLSSLFLISHSSFLIFS